MNTVTKSPNAEVMRDAQKSAYLPRGMVVIDRQWTFLRSFFHAHRAMSFLHVKNLLVLIRRHVVSLLKRPTAVGFFAFVRLLVLSLRCLIHWICSALRSGGVALCLSFQCSLSGPRYLPVMSLVFLASSLSPFRHRPTLPRLFNARLTLRGTRAPHKRSSVVAVLTFVIQTVMSSAINGEPRTRLYGIALRTVLFRYNDFGQGGNLRSGFRFDQGSFVASTAFGPFLL